MTDPSTVEVTQADRDAAETIFLHFRAGRPMRAIEEIARHRIASRTPAQGTGRTCVWLVEFPAAGDAYGGGKRTGPAIPTQYYCAIPKGDLVLSRTADPNEAMRFARKQDAEAMVARLDSDTMFQVGVKSGGFACEHMWIGSAQGTDTVEQFDRALEKSGREVGDGGLVYSYAQVMRAFNAAISPPSTGDEQ